MGGAGSGRKKKDCSKEKGQRTLAAFVATGKRKGDEQNEEEDIRKAAAKEREKEEKAKQLQEKLQRGGRTERWRTSLLCIIRKTMKMC